MNEIGGVNRWEIELVDWAGSMVGESCQWGATDCIMLMLQAIDIIRGTEYHDKYLGRWEDEATGRAYLGNKETPVGFLESIDAYRINKEFAAAGDIVLIESDAFPVCAHIVLGDRCLSGIPGESVGLVPTRWLLKDDPVVWRVC